MALAVKSYILIGYFLTILQHLNLAVKKFEKNDNKMSAHGCIYSPLTLAQCVHISSGVGVRVAYS